LKYIFSFPCDPMIILCTDGKFIDQLHGMFHEHLSRHTRTMPPKAIPSESSLVLTMAQYAQLSIHLLLMW
jgi:hypothetical protein